MIEVFFNINQQVTNIYSLIIQIFQIFHSIFILKVMFRNLLSKYYVIVSVIVQNID